MGRLRTARRQVPLDRADDYLLAWAAVRRAVEAAGARAWLFHGADHEDQFMEFIEWADDGTPPALNDDVAAALAQLDAFAPATQTDEWEETE